MIRAATDVGGTFTDIVFYTIDSLTGQVGPVSGAKVDTTSPRYDIGVMGAIAKAQIAPADIEFFAHGATIVINTITERSGARVGLITTRGFRDVLEIARGNRPDLFNFDFHKPKPFVPRHLRVELAERCTCTGEIEQPAALESLPEVLAFFRREGVESIAVCFLHAYVNSANESAVVARIRHLWPEVSVLPSHAVSGEWREYERTSTVVLSAYVHPIVQRYVESLDQSLSMAGLRQSPFMMLSSGGISTAAAVKSNPISMVESGPASGLYAATRLGSVLGKPNLMVLDIGGTTAKCALVKDGKIALTTSYYVERTRQSPGYPIQTPVSDLVEIGNGGGSIAWVDRGGKLHVGPKSAGALPGPIGYGRGGEDPTTTDANLLLGRIDPDQFCGGQVQPNLEAVRTAFEVLGASLGISAIETARGVIRIANANMATALRRVSTHKGYDPRDFALVAFGGGGPMHAVALAEELKIPEVIVPANSSVFSAWGMLLTDLRHDFVRTRLLPLTDSGAAQILEQLLAMRAEAAATFLRDVTSCDEHALRFEFFVDMRYVGQEHTVRVPVEPDQIVGHVTAIAERFHRVYEQRFTYRLVADIQVVNFHVAATCPVPKPDWPQKRITGYVLQDALTGTRAVDFGLLGEHDTPIFDGLRLDPTMATQGPAIIQEPNVTLVISPGHHLSVDAYGNYRVRLVDSTADTRSRS